MQTTDMSDRLTRSRSDRLLAGVAAGLAHYLAIDPVLVRLGFVALAFTGVGILVYPLLWLIMPQEGSVAPSVGGAFNEMRAQAVQMGDKAREALGGKAQPASASAPQAEQPTGDEVPISDVTPTRAPAQRAQLLGYVLLAFGGFLLLDVIAPGAEALVFPLVLVVVGVALLRRRTR
jgi:phage shock protein C